MVKRDRVDAPSSVLISQPTGRERHVDNVSNPNSHMMKMRYLVVFILICAAAGFGGCADYYAGYPGYGSYYGHGPYNYGARPYYGGGSVVVAVGDRPYYRGPGYWYGQTYYVWKPGHWGWRHGQQVWIRGHYVVRGY